MVVSVGCGASEPNDTETPDPTVEVAVQPSETAVQPTETSVPPTETPIPPTDTAVPPTPEPTDTPEPPTPTPEPTPEPTNTPGPTPVWAAGLIGNWHKPELELGDVTFFEQFTRIDDDGKLYVSDTLGDLIYEHDAGLATAIYWFEGDIFVIKDARIFEGGCGLETIGRYQISIVPNESMDIDFIDDECGARGSVLTGIWNWRSP